MTRECKWMEMEVRTYRHRGAYFLHIFYFIWVAIFQFCNRNKKEPLNTCHEMIFAEVKEISSHLQGPLPFCSILFYEVLKTDYTERKQKVHWFFNNEPMTHFRQINLPEKFQLYQFAEDSAPGARILRKFQSAFRAQITFLYHVTLSQKTHFSIIDNADTSFL